MRANDASAPVVLGPAPPPAHTHLPPHCRTFQSPAPLMPARPSEPSQDKSLPPFQPRKPTAPRSDNQQPISKTSSTTLSTSSSLNSSPKTQPKDTPPKSPTTCEGCSQPHDGSYGSGRFCSVHCARRIAASRKWEKQRTQRKRAAAAAAAAASANVDHSTSSLSSASSDDRSTQKRQRVVVMQGMLPVPHPAHHPNLVHPQPQHFQRPIAFPGMRPHPYSAAASTLSNTPTPPPLPHRTPSPYMDYSTVPPRALTPVQYHPGYYPYQTGSVAYASTPPPYPMYTSASPHHIPPPPPPTPAPDTFNRGTAMPAPISYPLNAHVVPIPTQTSAPQGLVSSERECEAVAEALLCLRTGTNSE